MKRPFAALACLLALAVLPVGSARSLAGQIVPEPAAQGSGVTLVAPTGEQRFSMGDLASMPRTTLTVDDHGTRATFEGVELRLLLAKIDAPLGDKLRGKALRQYVTVEAADGYGVIFALAELDTGFTDSKVILADRRDGKPIGADEGPLRVIVEKDKRMGRSARQVTRIELAAAK
jgi:hypothetical protein